MPINSPLFTFFFFNDPPTSEIYTLSLHDALPISDAPRRCHVRARFGAPRAAGRAGRLRGAVARHHHGRLPRAGRGCGGCRGDRGRGGHRRAASARGPRGPTARGPQRGARVRRTAPRRLGLALAEVSSRLAPATTLAQVQARWSDTVGAAIAAEAE